MSSNVVVQLVDSPDDFPHIYRCISEAFGRQIKDSIWIAMNPGWDTPEGQREGASKLLERWQSAVTKDKYGRPNTVILKATLLPPSPPAEESQGGGSGASRIIGTAIWTQASFVAGHGDPPTQHPAAIEALPCATDRRFASQMYRSLWRRRVSLTLEKATASPPAVLALDTCAVDPAFQRRGVAGKLVAWGLEEARRRGGLECVTEASPMGRVVYGRLGFAAEGGEGEDDLVYEVDEEFRDRNMPEILFMRTWAGRG